MLTDPRLRFLEGVGAILVLMTVGFLVAYRETKLRDKADEASRDAQQVYIMIGHMTLFFGGFIVFGVTRQLVMGAAAGFLTWAALGQGEESAKNRQTTH